MDGLIYALGIIGNVIALLMFLSPMKTFTYMVKKKSTEDFEVLPYMATLLNTSLWVYYALLMPVGGMLLLTISTVGASLNLLYLLLFILYAPKNLKIKSVKQVAALNIVFPVAVIVVAQLAFKGRLRLRITGFICAALAIGMYAAPLSVMRRVTKTKSVEYMPFLLSLCQFFNSGVWLAYALMLSDYFLGVPNGIGFALGSIQLILYAIYKNRSVADECREKIEEKDQVFHIQEDVNGSEGIKVKTSVSKLSTVPKHGHDSKNKSHESFTKRDIEKGSC